MYDIVLTLHSLLRWIVILFGLWAVVTAAAAASRRSWTPGEARPGLLFTIGLDLQLLLGLVLYVVLSPITRTALTDFGAAMQTGALRFWAVEHPALMVVAVALAHAGRSATRYAGSDRAGARARLWFGLALLALLLATPWPFMPNGRPWFRLPI
jgi:hypothetical protein